MIYVNHCSNHYTLVFDLIAHESIACIHDQVLNFSLYAPGNAVIIHLSSIAPFGLKELYHCLSDITGIGIYLNPARFETTSTSLLRPHLSNWVMLKNSSISCKYLVIEASNSMFCRHGVQEHIVKFNCGYRNGLTVEGFENCGWPNHPMKFDECFINYIQKPLHNCQPEGSWFDYKMFLPVIDELSQYVLQYGYGNNYNTEEVYAFMMWQRKYPEATTSDSYLWMKQTDDGRGALYLTSEPMTIDEIKSVADGRCAWGNNVYSVKRIPREYNHPSRVFIRRMKK